jgi:hypothetical protein
MSFFWWWKIEMRGKKRFERMNEGSESSVELLSEWKGGTIFQM